MDDQRAEASLVHERALLLEALTLLVQRQAETEAALTNELARTTTRVAAIERRSIELENRLAPGVEKGVVGVLQCGDAVIQCRVKQAPLSNPEP